MRFIFLALGLIALDQASKWAVMTKMDRGESIPLIDNIFHLTYLWNPGAAFSIFPNRTIFFIIISSVVVVGIILFASRIPKGHLLLKTGLAFQLGGAVGNLLDRLRFGHVIDFFDFRVWPVFNIADMAIFTGVGILIFELIRSERAGKTDDLGTNR